MGEARENGFQVWRPDGLASEATHQGVGKRLRAGVNAVILWELGNNRVAFCAGSELPVDVLMEVHA